MTRELVPAGRRELEKAHIRFYRAVLEGVDLLKAWDTFLPIEGDFHDALAKATMGWVRQALIQEALAAGKKELIGLFRREPWRVKTSAKPTLAEFSERFADAGEFSEREILELWKEEYGGADANEKRAEARRERLNQRLREALELLERATRKAPARSDAVATWLAPNLAEHLVAAGLKSLGAVADALRARKTPRWEEVPGVGEVWAGRLQTWFDGHGLQPPSPALPATAPVASPLVPLERFEVREVRPGATTALPLPAVAAGILPFSQVGNALGVMHDRDAIQRWLDAKATNPNTLRAYRKNAERLLLWCHLERQCTFAEMNVGDAIHYRTFLETLGRQSPEEWEKAHWKLPASEWIGPRAAKRDGPLWRPFDGPLAPDSISQDLLTVRALFKFLKEGRYVQDNVWDLIGKKPRVRASLVNATEQFVGRSFTMDEWRHVVDGLRRDGPELERRLLLILWLGFACGLRAAEMLSLSLRSIIPGPEIWRLRVLGKGDKVRTVPLPSPARDAMLAYLDSVGVDYETVVELSMAPATDERADAPILRGRRGRRGKGALPEERLHYTRMYNVLKGHLESRALDLKKRDPVAAGKFERASTHWLRHTCATLALKNGVGLPGVQMLLGHSTLTTTTIYVTEQAEALMMDMERFASGAATSIAPS